MNKKLFFFLVFLFFNSNVFAEDRDIILNKLFDELKINQTKVASIVEQEIWNLWSTHPTDEKLTIKLKQGSKFIRNQKLNEALEIFTEVINLDQNWAEAWNKRATVLYMIGDYEASQNDIDKVLNLEKRHFGALAGQGLVNIKLKNYEKAIESYEKAQEIYPAMQSPKIMIREIKQLINQQMI